MQAVSAYLAVVLVFEVFGFLADKIGENLEETGDGGDGEEEDWVDSVRSNEIEENNDGSRPDAKAPGAGEEVGNGAPRASRGLLKRVALPYLHHVPELLPNELRDGVIDHEASQTPGRERHENEIHSREIGEANARFGLQDDGAHHNQDQEKDREYKIPKILIGDAHRTALLYTAGGPDYKNKQEYACHYRNKAEEKLVEGLVEHAKSIASQKQRPEGALLFLRYAFELVRRLRFGRARPRAQRQP